MSPRYSPQPGHGPGRFFTDPGGVAQRRHEALRAYFVERRPGPQVAPAKQAARDE